LVLVTGKLIVFHYRPVIEKAKGRMPPVVIDDLRSPDLLTIQVSNGVFPKHEMRHPGA